MVSALCLVQLLAVSAIARAQAPLRKIGELELSVLGLTATPSPLNATVPKNTASGIRVVVNGGAGWYRRLTSRASWAWTFRCRRSYRDRDSRAA